MPYKNQDAFSDFMGQHDLWWRALTQQIFLLTGTTIRTYPLGTGGGSDWLARLQQQYENASTALGIAQPPDLETYDLSQPGDFASWTWILSQQARQLAVASGL